VAGDSGELERLRAANVELSAANGELSAANVELRALVEALRAEIEELGRRVGMNSGNSSKPPSSDGPGVAPRSPRKSSGGKHGAQWGHRGNFRALVGADRVNETVERWPSVCGGCNEPLPEGQDAAPVWRHQVFELPDVAVEVREYRMHRVSCAGCGRETREGLPDGVPVSCFGPRLCALVVKLSVCERLSHRQIAGVLSELLGCAISIGSVAAILKRAGDAHAETHQELVRFAHSAPVLNVDETGWRLPGQRWWCWGAFTSKVAVLMIRATRERLVLKALSNQAATRG